MSFESFLIYRFHLLLHFICCCCILVFSFCFLFLFFNLKFLCWRSWSFVLKFPTVWTLLVSSLWYHVTCSSDFLSCIFYQSELSLEVYSDSVLIKSTSEGPLCSIRRLVVPTGFSSWYLDPLFHWGLQNTDILIPWHMFSFKSEIHYWFRITSHNKKWPGRKSSSGPWDTLSSSSRTMLPNKVATTHIRLLNTYRLTNWNLRCVVNVEYISKDLVWKRNVKYLINNFYIIYMLK